MSMARYRVFKSALNDVTYWEGRPLSLREGIAYINSNAFVAAVAALEKRQEAALQKSREEKREKEAANG